DSTYNKESIDNTKHGTYRVDDIENSSVWKEGYTIFNSSLNENEKSKKLKTYRDYLLNIKSNPVDKEVFLEKSISLINNLWMLSKKNNNVPEFVNFIISLLNDIEENNLTNILYSFYSFIDFSIQIKSARQISNTQLLALDKEMLENFSNNLIQFPKQIVEINKCIEMMPDESLKISKRMRYKVVINDLKTIYESLNGAKKTPEVICLIYTIKIWIKLLEDALSLVLKRIECKIVFNDTIFFNKWNNIEIEVYGGYSEDYFEIKMLPISDYDVEIEEHIVHFEDKKECGSFNLKIKPKKIGDLRLVFTIDTRAFTLPINVIPLNPFVVGRPIKCSDMFFGREELLNEIIRGLLSPSSINYILTGRRRIGKTSFLYALKRNLPQYVLPVLISMEVSDEKLNNIFQLFINEIIFSLKEREIIINKDLMDTKIDKKDPSNSFLDWLRRLIPELMINSIKRIYILIDEALIITELNQHAQSLFRYIFSNIDGIGGILASPPDIIKRLNYSVSSPWYNIFKTAKIGPFTKEETKTLIESNLKNYNIEKVDKIAEKTYQYSGGLPYYVQAIGYELIENYHHLEKHDDLFRLSINGLKHKLSTSYPVVLENLSPIEKIAIVSIANNFHPPDVCTKKLFEADLIIQLKEGWEIPSKIEKEWIINLSERLLNSAGESLWKKYGNHLEFPKLVTEIEMVLKELSKKKTKNDSLIVALDAAKAKDGAKVLGYLGLAGKKVLDAASKIGTEVAAEYIKASLGLK
ncbi:MAG TPA: hypothetical protein DDX98_04345, partial [Bacteroidales bacterium]|nr:hypothetical protein [Bacteroidales bacterium]